MRSDPAVVVANRSEVAVRVIRAARGAGLRTLAMYAREDRDALHVRLADDAVELPGRGAAAYLDIPAVVDASRHGGDGSLVHPGYGFLSESAEFAEACVREGFVFVGPSADALRLFGDKQSARGRATDLAVPVLPATPPAGGLAAVERLLSEHPDGVMIKAVGGGGGRGMREVTDPAALADAYERCRAEARAGFGDDRVYAEALLQRARHIEVQVIGDGRQTVAVGDRDCSVQRHHQKLLEIAPAPGLTGDLRAQLHEHAIRLIGSTEYVGLATVEFLVASGDCAYFMEVNPRLQVEHTVTEQVTGLDLVALQLAVGSGRTLADLVDAGDLALPAPTLGAAVQARVNTEALTSSGEVLPVSGVLDQFTAPAGPGIRVDTAAYPGHRQTTSFDSLLAKVIATAGTPAASLRRCADGLGELVVSGVDTNAALLRAALADLQQADWETEPPTTDWFETHRERLLAAARDGRPPETAIPEKIPHHENVDFVDGEQVVRARMSGRVVHVVDAGSELHSGSEVVVLEAMKMEHGVTLDTAAQVRQVLVEVGEIVESGSPLVTFVTADSEASQADDAEQDLDHVRDDLAEVRERHRKGLDEARVAAVDKRHAGGRRTARENIEDLVDEGSFVEYGPLAIAAQRRRRSDEDLIANTPADGLVAGVASVNAEHVGSNPARVVVMSYDYTVLAGTQGMRNHAKTDRMLELARRQRVPLVLFAEGGGGRPGDTDHPGVSGLDVTTFRAMGALSGEVPTVGITGGRCFAGNAALLGMCDVVIATADANIGMGGPAMIEGGGLGVYAPEQIGPVEVQKRNGVVHLVAEDDADAVRLARCYLSYFQGPVDDWAAPDPRWSRRVVPENRLRAYDVRAAIGAVVDLGSMLELRADWAPGIVTALVRVEGHPYGLIANDGRYLGGAIDAEGSDKLSAFLQLCNSHHLPVVSLCDTPGFMVGPDIEKDATVARFSRLFVDGARMTVPFGTVILRKAYGLGAQAMAAGSFRAPRFIVSWPTGEVGGMGLEGAVRLGYRKELEAIDDPVKRKAEFDRLVALAYAEGKALTAAAVLEIDDVIDPADTRRWIATLVDPQP